MALIEWFVPRDFNAHLKKILSTELSVSDHHHGHRKFFYMPGHIILLPANRQQIIVFSKVPLQGQKVIFDSDGTWKMQAYNMCSPIVQLSFLTCHVFITVQENGQLCHWWLDINERRWHNKYILLSSEEDIKVCSAAVFTTQKALFWCEEIRRDGDDRKTPTYVVKTTSMNTDLDGSFSLGSQTALLTDCPPCALHQTDDCILFCFSEPCPSGVYVVWRPVNRMLSFCIHGYGAVTNMQIYSQPMSFHQVMLQTSALWLKASSLNKWTIVKGSEQAPVRLLSPDGRIWHLSTDNKVVYKASLQDWCKMMADNVTSQNIMLYNAIGILSIDNKHNLRLHNSETGQLLHTENAEERADGLWVSVNGINAGFVSSKGFLQAKQTDTSMRQESLASTDPVIQLLQTAMDSGHQLQSEALYLAALHQMQGDMDLPLRQQFQKYLRHQTKDHPHTKLQTILEPLLQKYRELDQLGENILESQPSSSPLTVLEEVRSLLPPSESVRQQDVYFRLSLLGTRHPRHVAEAVLARTGVGHEIQEEEEVREICSYLRSTSGRQILSLIAHLIFKQRPDCLVAFLNRIINYGRDDTAAFQKQTQAALYSELLDTLSTTKTASDAQCTSVITHILSNSGNENSDEKSLSLLVQRGLWTDAVQLLKELQPQNEKLPQLFWMLVIAAAEAGLFSELCDSLLDVAPPNLSIASLLHHIDKTAGASSGAIEKEKTDFPIGKLVHYISNNAKQ